MKYISQLVLIVFLNTGISYAAGRLPFVSGFETGDFSEWNGGLDSSLIVSNIDSHSGSYAARSTMTLGSTTDNYKDFYFGDHPQVGGEPASGDLWLKFFIKFEPGFQFGDVNTHKIAIINFENEFGRRRYQIVLNVWTSTQRYFIENLAWNPDGSFDRGISGMPQNMTNPSTVQFGIWDEIKLYIKTNTPGQANGIVRMWINGELKLEYTDRLLREDTNYNPNKLILSNYVTNTDVSGVQWWDDFYLGETDPDSAPPPAAPYLHPIQ